MPNSTYLVTPSSHEIVVVPEYYQLEFLSSFVSHLETKVLEVVNFACCQAGSEEEETTEGCRCLDVEVEFLEGGVPGQPQTLLTTGFAQVPWLKLSPRNGCGG